jgi:serine/threonine-protein kinase RsbW
MVNAVVHGNRYNARKKVYLNVLKGTGRITVVIRDEGEGFDFNALPDPLAEENLLRQSGRGLLLIQAFMDEFQIQRAEPRGTEVKMVKYLAQQDN